MKPAVLALAGLVAMAGVGGLAGCESTPTAEKINPGPSMPVQFAVERVSPAVVRLDVVTQDYAGGTSRPSSGIGSGVIIDAEGHILTNFHVAGRASRIDITLANLERVKATLVGSDHWTDLAIVKLDMDEVKRRGLTFQWAPLGDSAEVQLGQPVLAMGTPHGLTRTLTQGIVSNTNRFFQDTAIDEYETGWFNNWIQTDAAINPGNSGGPLINLRGEVIGINTRGSPTANNLGFAIPANVAKGVVNEILGKTRKKVTRSYVGVQLQPLQDLERFYELDLDRGVLVRSVDEYSPAAQAGVEAEDILLAINDKPVLARFPEQLADIRKLVADMPVGTDVKLTIQRGKRGSEVQTVTVKTEELESRKTEESAIGEWGLTVRPLTRAYLRKNRLPLVEGVLVTGVRSATLGDTAGLQEGDIVLRVNRQAVTSVEELKDAVAAWKKAGKPIAVDIRRDRAEQTKVVKGRE